MEAAVMPLILRYNAWIRTIQAMNQYWLIRHKNARTSRPLNVQSTQSRLQTVLAHFSQENYFSVALYLQ